MEDLTDIDWNELYNLTEVNSALYFLMQTFTEICDKLLHAPAVKGIVKGSYIKWKVCQYLDWSVCRTQTWPDCKAWDRGALL